MHKGRYRKDEDRKRREWKKWRTTQKFVVCPAIFALVFIYTPLFPLKRSLNLKKRPLIHWLRGTYSIFLHTRGRN